MQPPLLCHLFHDPFPSDADIIHIWKLPFCAFCVLPDRGAALAAPLEEAPPRGGGPCAAVHHERLDGDAALVREGRRLGRPRLLALQID